MITKDKDCQYLVKDYIFDIKDVSITKNIVTGYFAAFDNIDSDKDMIMPGAFKKTIKERGVNGTNEIQHLLQHDTWSPLAKPNVLKEDKKGLYFESEIIDTSWGIDTLKLYAGGVYNQHSIGYRIVKGEDIKDKEGLYQYTKLYELFLWEGSTVTFGANKDTPFNGFKSKDKPGLFKEVLSRIERINKAFKINDLTDETYNSFELALIQLETLIKTLSEPEQSTPEPFNAIKYMNENLKFI